MMPSRVHKISAAAACLVAAVTSAALSTSAGADSAADVPTYKEFEASTYVDVDGAYVVNGDEAISSRRDLRKFYELLVGPSKADEAGLIVNTVNGQDDKWSASQALNLTYCVSTRFGSRHDDVVAAMEAGAGLWEAATSKVDFTHVPSQDGSCTVRNRNVLFSVQPVSTTQYIARAFFPSTPVRQRSVLIDESIWTSGILEPGDILGHELGHVLGFRHEHARPESGTCFENSNWRPLTPYDAASIMHYPQCNGSSDDLEFQASDAAGVRALYGS